MTGMPSGRAVPFYCPYCSEEDLRPTEDSHGSWLCAACRRVFAVRLIGISPVQTTRSLS